MGKIGEFLNNKPWHPSSRQNQTLLFEAEERQREEQQRLEERQEELKQERAREELDALLPNRGGAKPAGIDFMYKAPTGTNTSGAAPRSGAHDEAALAFEARRLAAARRKRGEPEPIVEKAAEPEPPEPEPEPERPSKTFDAHAEARRVDPAERQRNLTSAAIAQTALDARNRLVLKAAATAAVASDGVVRAHGSGNEGYALLDDDDDAEEDADAALLASLSSREKRALLKRLAGDDEGDESRRAKKRKKKSKKKSKKKKKRKRSSSSSSSSSS